MEFQPYQILFVFFYVASIIAFIKINNKYFRMALAAFVLAIFLFNPFRFAQKGGASLEKIEINKFENIPERVVVEKTSFEESQKEEMEKLKQQTEDMKDEIHN